MSKLVTHALRPGVRGLIAALALGSCAQEGTGPSLGRTVRVDPTWVVGAAANAIGPDGLFNFDYSLPPAGDEMSRDEALQFAWAAVRHVATAVGNARKYIEDEEHGGPIAWTELAPCGRRIFPVFTNLADPGQVVPHYVRTPLGAAYDVEFCSLSGVRTVHALVLVRTLASIRADGSIDFPQPGGTEFLVSGIPLRPLTDLTPEYAARIVSEKLGIRISEVPELDGCMFVFRICAGLNGRHWRFRLERAVRVRLSSGVILESDLVYTQAGFGALAQNQLYVASPSQPSAAWEPFVLSNPGQPFVQDSVLVSVARPLKLERFELVK